MEMIRIKLLLAVALMLGVSDQILVLKRHRNSSHSLFQTANSPAR